MIKIGLHHEKTLSLLLFAFSLGMFIVTLNASMFNVALPDIQKEISISVSAASWLSAGYTLLFGLSIVTYTKFVDYFSIRKLLIVGISTLTVASLGLYIVEQYPTLLILRLLQATGAAAIPGLAMVWAMRHISEDERAYSLLIIFIIATSGFALGPLIGGTVTQYIGWRYIFLFISSIVFILPIFYIFLDIKDVNNHKRAAPISKAYFVMWQMPGTIASMALFSLLFMLPFILTHSHNMNAIHIGLFLFPGTVMSALITLFIGRINHRISSNGWINGGLLCLLLAFLIGVLCSNSSLSLLLMFILAAIGYAFVSSAVSQKNMVMLRDYSTSIGLGFGQLIQLLGASLGVLILGNADQDWEGLQFVKYFSLGMVVVIIIGLFFSASISIKRNRNFS